MTAAELAALHAAAFVVPRPWSAGEITDLLASPSCFLVEVERGFALGRAVADEAELLTIVVDPAQQGRGLGRVLLARFLVEAVKRGAERVFLEVAETNAAARALYSHAGFAEVGRRRGYYDGVDALLMEKGAVLSSDRPDAPDL